MLNNIRHLALSIPRFIRGRYCFCASGWYLSPFQVPSGDGPREAPHRSILCFKSRLRHPLFGRFYHSVSWVVGCVRSGQVSVINAASAMEECPELALEVAPEEPPALYRHQRAESCPACFRCRRQRLGALLSAAPGRSWNFSQLRWDGGRGYFRRIVSHERAYTRATHGGGSRHEYPSIGAGQNSTSGQGQQIAKAPQPPPPTSETSGTARCCSGKSRLRPRGITIECYCGAGSGGSSGHSPISATACNTEACPDCPHPTTTHHADWCNLQNADR